jgi:hypothetical protein
MDWIKVVDNKTQWQAVENRARNHKKQEISISVERLLASQEEREGFCSVELENTAPPCTIT